MNEPNTIDVRSLVEAALNREWPAFAKEHPALASVIDPTLLLEQATMRLDADPAFHRAVAAGAAAGQALELVARIVHRWLRTLL